MSLISVVFIIDLENVNRDMMTVWCNVIIVCFFSYRFLHIVESWEQWPCLKDAEGTVISLPPLTNSDSTKVNRFPPYTLSSFYFIISNA